MNARGLNSNILKIIAAVAMTIDHIGMILFPQEEVFRMIGRIAFPLFAFFIAEGCQYTHDKKKYLGLILFLGLIFQLVFTLATGQTMLNVFLTFSLSIVLVYFLQWFKKEMQKENLGRKMVSGFAFFTAMLLVYWFTSIITVDYGFSGTLIPVLITLFDDLWKRKAAFVAGTFLLVISIHTFIQSFCLLAIFILLFYNGKKGKLKLKYFFYVFYPLHLSLLFLLKIIL